MTYSVIFIYYMHTVKHTTIKNAAILYSSERD